MANGAQLRPRVPAHAGTLLFYVAAAGVSLVAGASLAYDRSFIWLGFFALAGLTCALAVEAETLFVAWLLAAPLLQGAAGGGETAHPLFTLFYLVPPLILAARMALGDARVRRFWAIDALPALYLAYVLVSEQFTSPELKGSAGLTSIYGTVGLGVVLYYFIAFGHTSRRLPTKIATCLIWSGIAVAALTLLDSQTGWNPYGDRIVQHDGLARSVATLTSPFALGTFLGATVSFALAIVYWNGPRSLRKPSIFLVVLALPAVYFTYSRGPILALAVVGVLLSLIAARARWRSLLVLVAVGASLFAIWGQISSSAVYQERFRTVGTVNDRLALQDASIALARERPVLGWGYGTFDKAKTTVATRDAAIVDATTSHDAFLTILAELGIVGLLLFALPWIVIGWRAAYATRRGLVESWLVAGSLGVLGIFAIGAATYDTRFFSFVSALPWIALGLARNALAEGEASVESA
jgi:O-antigen ligase